MSGSARRGGESGSGAESPACRGASRPVGNQGRVQRGRGSERGNRPRRRAVPAGEGVVAVARSGPCTGERGWGPAEPEAGFEESLRRALSGCGRETPEAEVWGSGGGRGLGNGQERRAAGWGAASWG